jgi:hypothetical protein
LTDVLAKFFVSVSTQHTLPLTFMIWTCSLHHEAIRVGANCRGGVDEEPGIPRYQPKGLEFMRSNGPSRSRGISFFHI